MNSATQMTKRRNAIVVMLLIFFVGIAARLVYIQAIKGPELADEARANRLRTYTNVAPRGDIVDINGEVMATSAVRYHIAVNQQKVAGFILRDDEGQVVDTGASAASDLLAPILGEDPAVLGGKMVGDSTWVYLKKSVEPTVWREIRSLGIPGIEPERVSERLYPNGNTAGNLVGYVGKDGEPLAGVEYSFNDALTGTDGYETVEIGRGGQVIPTGTSDSEASVAGDTVQLSINRDVQFVAQEALDENVSKYGAEWAGVAVIDLQTHGLVALAESGMVDPSNPSASPASARNTARSVSSPYEPGSTGKLLTMAAAINEGVVDEYTVVEGSSRETIDGQVINDVMDHPNWKMTATGVLAKSSNVGTVQIGTMMSDETRYNYMRAFGFGQKVDIGLAGESAGILTPWDTWDGRSRLTTMFGQAYAVTLVQNAAMVATIGSGGVYHAPYLVEQITHPDGTVTVPERSEPRQVITEDSAATLLGMMESIPQEGGTGTKAYIDGFRVAGKTGTAQTSDANGRLTQVVTNFVGVVPADNPRFALAVVAYKPDPTLTGNIVSAPVFKEVAEFALHTYGVEPSQGEAPQFPLLIEEDE
ncbi:cell division protein FtsI (penicillin-binding protein 3) [Ruaniaceae bacterium KH17]|nr:cell division protein FtsI (penicillin-binding protein 3) [Ruaniaceae bacterium KH17]